MGGGVQKTLPVHTANHWPMHRFATPSAANCSVLFPLPLPGLAATYQVPCESSGGVDFLLAELPASKPVWFFDSLFVCLSVCLSIFEQQKNQFLGEEPERNQGKSSGNQATGLNHCAMSYFSFQFLCALCGENLCLGKFYLHCSRQCLCSLSRMLREGMTQQ